MSALVRAGFAHPRIVRSLALVAVAVVALAIPSVVSDFYLTLALNVLVFWLLAMSLDLLAGYTGLVSLGHAAFLGIGAYGVAYASSHGMGPWPAVGVALCLSVATSAVLGLVAARVANLTFVIVTLALGQIVWGLAYRWVEVTGGDNGMPVDARPLLGSIDLSDDATFYYFALAVAAVCGFAMWRLVRSPFGLSLRGIKGNERRMRTLGYSVTLRKYLAFVISGFFAGVAGVLFAFLNLYVSPTMMDFGHNGIVVMMVVLGGLGTLWGPLLGAIVVVLIQQDVSISFSRWESLLGVIFILAVLFLPDGLWGALGSVGRALRPRPGEPAPAERPARPPDELKLKAGG